MRAQHRDTRGPAPSWRYVPVVVLTLVLIVAFGFLSMRYLSDGQTARPEPEPTWSVAPVPSPTNTPTPTTPDPSSTATPEPRKVKPFLPDTLSVERIGSGDIERLARINVGENIQFPAPTGFNPSTYAWDTSSARPASKSGTVILVAHSYSSNQGALGNRLIATVTEGDQLVVHGDRSSASYTVRERLVLRGANAYYQVAKRWLDSKSSPTLALTVCSDYNPQTGDWDSRTVWLAELTK